MQYLQPVVSLLGVVVAAVGAAFGLWQYRKNQIWRETEFVAQQAKDFFADESVRSALKMLDWEKRNIELAPGKVVLVNREMLRAALVHGPDATTFTHDGAIIRDIFDIFFTRFENFEQFIKAGVITFDQVEPYIRYWAGLLTGERPHILDHKTIEVIQGFMKDYGYKDAADFLQRYQAKRPGNRMS